MYRLNGEALFAAITQAKILLTHKTIVVISRLHYPPTHPNFLGHVRKSLELSYYVTHFAQSEQSTPKHRTLNHSSIHATSLCDIMVNDMTALFFLYSNALYGHFTPKHTNTAQRCSLSRSLRVLATWIRCSVCEALCCTLYGYIVRPCATRGVDKRRTALL